MLKNTSYIAAMKHICFANHILLAPWLLMKTNSEVSNVHMPLMAIIRVSVLFTCYSIATPTKLPQLATPKCGRSYSHPILKKISPSCLQDTFHYADDAHDAYLALICSKV